MAVRIDHLALAARDAHTSATFLAEILDLPAPRRSGPFLAVDVGDTLTIDYAVPAFDFPGQHVAFLVGEDDFDAIRARLVAGGVTYYPARLSTTLARSTTIMAAAGCTSTIPADTISRSSPAATPTPRCHPTSGRITPPGPEQAGSFVGCGGGRATRAG